MNLIKKYGVRGKIIFSITLLIITLFIFETVSLNRIFLSSFKSVEEQDMIKAIQRIEGLIDNEIEHYSIKLSDWTTWDDTYNFIIDKNQAYIDSNITELALVNLKLNFMVFIASNGAVFYEKGTYTDVEKDLLVPKDLHELLSKSNAITTHKDIDSESHGIIRIKEGSLAFASRPILTSQGEGPIRGTLVFLKYIDKPFLKNIADLERSNVNIQDYYSESLPKDFAEAKQLIPTKGIKQKEPNGDLDTYYVNAESAANLDGFTIINDINGDKALIIENELSRPYYAIANRLIIFISLFLAFASIMSIIFAILLLNKLIVSKISKLKKGLGRIISSKNHAIRLDVSGDDEFAELASNINSMLDQIEKSELILKQSDIGLKKQKDELDSKVDELNRQTEAMLNILSDQKTLEDQLKQRAADLEKFRKVIENTSDHVIITDPDGKIVFANNAAEKLTGYSFEEMKGKAPSLWGRQMSHEFYAEMWDTIKNKKKEFVGEIANKNKSGQIYYVDAKITPVLNEKNEIAFFVGVERDLSSEKKLAERLQKENDIIERQVQDQTKEIEQSQKRLFKFLESIPEGIYVLDSKGKPFYANLAAKRLLGGEIITANLNQLSEVYNVYIANTNKLYPYEQFPLTAALNGQSVTVRDMEIRRKDKVIPLEITGAPIMDEYGNIVYALAVFHDITEEKIQERSKDEFFSIASHELRTPLTAIRGNTVMIKEYYQDKFKDDKDLNEMVDDIYASSVRLIGIVNDFLNVSRLEQGRLEFKLTNFDIVELIKKKIEEIANLAKEKNLEIKFEPSENTSNVYSDKDRLGEVILNLIGNAIKYSEKGTITVRVKEENDFVKVQVCDTGRGISLEQQKLLFRKFQQAGESLMTRDTTKGTGLGLYISKLLIDNMGGNIEIESSKEGEGSVFSFIVPVAKEN